MLRRLAIPCLLLAKKAKARSSESLIAVHRQSEHKPPHIPRSPRMLIKSLNYLVAKVCSNEVSLQTVLIVSFIHQEITPCLTVILGMSLVILAGLAAANLYI